MLKIPLAPGKLSEGKWNIFAIFDSIFDVDIVADLDAAILELANGLLIFDGKFEVFALIVGDNYGICRKIDAFNSSVQQNLPLSSHTVKHKKSAKEKHDSDRQSAILNCAVIFHHSASLK